MSDEESMGASDTDESRDSISAAYDWSTTSPTAAVVETVAAVTGREPTQLDPLFDSLDPEALDALVRSNGRGPNESDVTVAFAFAGHDVRVSGRGVAVRPDAKRP